MKYLKTYEHYNEYDLLKYFIFKSKIEKRYAIWEILFINKYIISLKRHYLLNSENEIIKDEKNSGIVDYDLLSIKELKKGIIYKSNNIKKTLEQLKLIKETEKYNI